jgi:hypothetical protein
MRLLSFLVRSMLILASIVVIAGWFAYRISLRACPTSTSSRATIRLW